MLEIIQIILALLIFSLVCVIVYQIRRQRNGGDE